MAESTTRRDFLKTAGLATAAVSMSAASYAKVQGANDRLSVAVIGCGQRGAHAHMPGLHAHDKAFNAEVTALADPWGKKRGEAAKLAKDWYGREPRQFVSYRDVLELDDIDAVMIASCDHQHTTHLKAFAEAKKDIYCEKPLGMDLEKLKAACDAVRANEVVCQIGTQLRSYPSFTGCKKLYETGACGTVGRIEQRRNGSRPYWYSRLAEVAPDDVDWDEFLMDAPKQPFKADRYAGWYGYRDFSDGPVPGLGSHFIDLVHYITGAKFPKSVVCHGGVYTWKDEHNFTCPDTVQAEWEYPEGFLVSYSTNFSNGSGNSFRIYGDTGAIDMVDWNNPYFTTDGTLSEKVEKKAGKEPIESVEMPDHVLDWLQCIRDRRTPNASIDAGYQHGVAVIMAMQAFDNGKRLVYDAEKREIHGG